MNCVKKKDLFWVNWNRKELGNANETGLTEGEGIDIETTVLPFTITIITI